MSEQAETKWYKCLNSIGWLDFNEGEIYPENHKTKSGTLVSDAVLWFSRDWEQAPSPEAAKDPQDDIAALTTIESEKKIRGDNVDLGMLKEKMRQPKSLTEAEYSGLVDAFIVSMQGCVDVTKVKITAINYVNTWATKFSITLPKQD